MPASRAAAALVVLMLTWPALAQQAQRQQAQSLAPTPRSGTGARPNAGAAGLGLAPLQTEPGDVWAEVRSWGERRGRAEPARRSDADPGAPTSRSRSSRKRAAETPG